MSHTIEQLWSERIEHGCSSIHGFEIPKEFQSKYVSLRPIRPIRDSANDERLRSAQEYDWKNRLNDAFYKYNRLATLNSGKNPWWKPKLNGRFDEFRYWLHLKLIQWKVVV